MRIRSAGWIPALALACFVLVAFWPAVVQEGVYFHRDASTYMARLAWAGGELRAGHFPSWNPHIALGVPNLSFYPVDLALFALLPKEWAYNLDLVVHVLLAALGMWALARRWNQSGEAAALAGAAYALGGFTMGHLQHLDVVVAVAWAPWCFAAVDRVLETLTPRSVAVAALVLGLDVTGGHVQVAFYTSLGLGVYAALEVLRLWRAKGAPWAARRAVGLGGAAVGALGLGTMFLWPFLEWVHFVSTRELYNPAGHVLAARGLLSLAAPLLEGGSRWHPLFVKSLIEHSAYCGLLPLALATLGICLERRRLFLVVLSAVSLLLALGPSGPLSVLQEALPLLGWGRAPVRYLVLVQFCVALLGGFGFDSVSRRKSSALVLGGLLLAAASGLGVALMVPAESALSVTLPRPESAILLATLALTAAALVGLSLASSLPESRRRLVAWLALAFVGSDLLVYGRGLPFNDLAPRDAYAVRPWARTILARGEPGRTFTYSSENDLRSWLGRMPPPLIYGLSYFGGAGGLEPARLLQFLNFVNAHFENRGPRLLGLFGGRYVLSREDLQVEGLTLVQPGVPKVYVNERALPLAYFARSGLETDDPDAALRTIYRADFDPRSTVIVEGPSAGSEGAADGLATIERATSDRVEVHTTASREAWLVLNEAFAPGWTASVDGQEARVFRGNSLVLTVLVPGGRHQVTFSYSPPWRIMGFLISSGTLLVLVAMAVLGRPRAA